MHGAHLNVLLVEDDPIAARVIQKMLSPDQGGPVTLQCADRLSTGLEYLAEAKTDAVLLDLGLPDSQWPDTLVRVLQQAPSVPVIVFTGADDEALAAEALGKGAQDYLVKGQVDTDLLVRALRHAIERCRMLAQLQQAQETAAQVKRDEARLEAAQRIEEKNLELEQANQEVRQAMQELRASERQLIQSEKLAAIGGLVAGVGHELNNPLMGVINYTQYCLERTAEDDPRHSRMVKAVREAQRCGRIVKALLSYSHGQRDAAGAPNEEVNCRALIMDMVSLLADDLRQLSVEVTVRAAEDLPPIRLDADALRQIMLNLLTNARDAVTHSTRKEITVQATVAGTLMTVSVQDSGCGMSEEVLNRLFDPFFTTKPAGQGTGLGMSVCQNLAEQSGGTLEVESKLGEGTVVTVRLPINQRFVDQARRRTGTDS